MDEITKYGLPGIIIGALAWFVMYLMKEHKNEREEWKRSNDRQNEESNRNIRENTNILSELATLLKNRR